MEGVRKPIRAFDAEPLQRHVAWRRRESKEADADAANFVVNTMRQNGVLLSRAGRYRNVLKIRPPLMFNKDNADVLVAELERAFKLL